MNNSLEPLLIFALFVAFRVTFIYLKSKKVQKTY
jgi:hypothetical protein